VVLKQVADRVVDTITPGHKDGYFVDDEEPRPSGPSSVPHHPPEGRFNSPVWFQHRVEGVPANRQRALSSQSTTP